MTAQQATAVILVVSLSANWWQYQAYQPIEARPVKQHQDAHQQARLDLDVKQSVDMELLKTIEQNHVHQAVQMVKDVRKKATVKRSLTVAQAAASDPALQKAVAQAIGVDPVDVLALGDTVTLTRQAALKLVDTTEQLKSAVVEERLLCGVSKAELRQRLVVDALAREQAQDQKMLQQEQQINIKSLQVAALHDKLGQQKKETLKWSLISAAVGLAVGVAVTTGTAMGVMK